MTDDEAKAMLAQLSAHYRQPVMPIRRYCEALETWRRACEEGARGEPNEARTNRFVEHIPTVFTAIRKSNLLSRLIYEGEELRTEKCPLHKGLWSGCSPDACPHGCSSGHNVTGWIATVKP